MKAFLALIKRICFGETTIEKIVGPMQKIARDLDEYSSRQAYKAMQREQEIETLGVLTESERQEAVAAEKLALSYRKSGLIKS